MVVELVLEVDENDIPLGLRSREDFYKSDIIHRSSVLLLFNNNGELLLQKRSKYKKWFPGLFDFSVGGTVNDETYEECMNREIKEEIGIGVKCKFLFKLKPSEKKDKAYHSVFIAKTNQQLNLDYEEIESVEWISMEKLKEEFSNNPKKFTPQLLVGLKKFFKYTDSAKK